MSADEPSMKMMKTEEDELQKKELQDTHLLSLVEQHEDSDEDHHTSHSSEFADSLLIVIKAEPEEVVEDKDILPTEWSVQEYEDEDDDDDDDEDEDENHHSLHELNNVSSVEALETDPDVQIIKCEYESKNQHISQQEELYLPPLCKTEPDTVEVPHHIYSDDHSTRIHMWSVQHVGSKQILEFIGDHETVNTNDGTLSSSVKGNKASPGREISDKKVHRKRRSEKHVSASHLLEKHNKEHKGFKRYSCSECGSSYSKSSAFYRHMRMHTGQQKLFQCSQCEKCFTQSRSLKSHQRTHTGEKPYQCNQCGKTYTRLDVLQVHQKTHTGEKPYICSQCGKSFYRLDRYQTHCRTHTGEKPYQCSLCAKTFARLDSCQNHQMTHTGEKPYQCTICERRFLWLSNLKNHERTHTEERPYQCSLCEKTFIQSGHLTKHLKKHSEQKI